MSQKETLRETIVDDIAYTAPSWEQMSRYNFELSEQIIASGLEFDRVVALAKGGWTWARSLVDYLNVPNLSTTRLRSYTAINQCSEKIDVVQPLSDRITGERVLIFDDVADSGKTLDFAKRYMESLGAESVTTATLCFKPRSCSTPNFHSFVTTSWVIFPHEIRESIDKLAENWSKTGNSQQEIRTRLLDIGLPDFQIDTILPRKISQLQHQG